MKKVDMSPAKKPARKVAGGVHFYPILFGLYPVLALTAYNISQIDLFLAYRSIIFSAVLALVLFGLLRLMLRDWGWAAVLATILLVLFFSYGHVYALIEKTKILGVDIGRHRYLLSAWAVLVGLGLWLSTRKRINPAAFTPALNIVSALLLVFPLYRIIQVQIENRPRFPVAENGAQPADGVRPDIYYIILDAYGRADVLQEVFGQDNSSFVQALTDRGFYVAGCSQSNYTYTLQSLGSSLNLDYIDESSAADDNSFYKFIQRNVTRQFLESQGYTTVAFETGFRWTQWEDADIYITYGPSFTALNGFELMFLETTLVRPAIDQAIASQAPTTYESIHYQRIMYELHTLKNLPGLASSPKFVFAHLVVPHPPDVFGPNGEFSPQPGDETGRIPAYRNAVRFINGEIIQVVDAILANSETPPVIVIQGDHGPFLYSTPHEDMKILNAYYLPGHLDLLYPTVSPVNTFRIIFDTYFGQHYPILEDASWFSPPEDRWNYESVPTGCDK